eukprot:s561_g15.t1
MQRVRDGQGLGLGCSSGMSCLPNSRHELSSGRRRPSCRWKMSPLRVAASATVERACPELNRTMQQKEISEKVLRNTNHEKRQLQETVILLSIFEVTRMWVQQ